MASLPHHLRGDLCFERVGDSRLLLPGCAQTKLSALHECSGPDKVVLSAPRLLQLLGRATVLHLTVRRKRGPDLLLPSLLSPQHRMDCESCITRLPTVAPPAIGSLIISPTARISSFGSQTVTPSRIHKCPPPLVVQHHRAHSSSRHAFQG